MSSFFSEGLLRIARPHMAWVSEQMRWFEQLVPVGPVDTDFDRRTAWQSGRELRIAFLGSYAEDGTWLWGWANQHSAQLPVSEESARLRAIGDEHGAPELAEGLVDLTHLPDPRLGSDHLAMLSMGLLGARGLIVFNHAGRARTFLAVTDPAISWARPNPAEVESYLRTGASLLAGADSLDGYGYAEAVVHGYLAHHRLTARTGPGLVSTTFDGGDVLTVRIDDADHIEEVEITGPDGGSPRPDAPSGDVVPTAAPERVWAFPAGLLDTVLPNLAQTVGQDFVTEDHLEGLGWDEGTPVWDAVSGMLHYPGFGDLTGHEVGSYDPATGTWTWSESEWEGTARLRAAAQDNGHPEVAAARVDLSEQSRPANTAEILARTASALGGGRGLASIPETEGRIRYVAVTTQEVPSAGPDLDVFDRTVLAPPTCCIR